MVHLITEVLREVAAGVYTIEKLEIDRIRFEDFWDDINYGFEVVVNIIEWLLLLSALIFPVGWAAILSKGLKEAIKRVLRHALT